MKKETIVQLETAIDHLSGEEIGSAIRALSESDFILDVVYLPGIGKKNRPCGLLQVLCAEGREERAATEIFRHTHTLGVRIQKIERFALDRREAEAIVAGKTIRAKEYELESRPYLRPEADELERLAEESSLGAPAFRFGVDGDK